jgi:uncharacterized repeat protein (TIGR03803 family)
MRRTQPLRKAFSISVPLAVIMIFVTAAWAASTEKVLYTFTGREDGASPISGLIFDHEGNLYGTASAGGSVACIGGEAIGCGTVFELTPSAGGGWMETVIYSFQGGADGAEPKNLIFDRQGNLYGTTYQGGGPGCFLGCGTVFKLAHAHGAWVESVLYRFQGGSDGAAPGGVVLDATGTLYGATYLGGDLTCGYQGSGCGVVFKLTLSGSGEWNETVLHRFGSISTDGHEPNPGMVFDRKGNLYGTTEEGGTAKYGYGTVFELTPNSGGDWTETLLYSFSGRRDGGIPIGGVISDKSGNLYGANYNGGLDGGGDVFKLKPLAAGGNRWREKAIYNFGGQQSDGFQPDAGVTFDKEGNLYGTTQYGGGNGYGNGTVVKLTPNLRGGWTETVLYGFSGGSDGGQPVASVIVDSAGNVYGTTWVGGTGDCSGSNGNGCGVVFEVTP